MTINESAVPHRQIQALRIHEGELPIFLVTLGTFPNPTSVEALESLTIKMYETHRGKLDSSEVFVADANQEIEGGPSDIEKPNSRTKQGEHFCRNRKRPQNHETSRGAINHLSAAP